MSGKFMSPESVQRLLALADQPYRPPQILQLKEEIEARTRALELRSSVTGRIDQEEVSEIVRMKISLDGLYSIWAEGELDGA